MNTLDDTRARAGRPLGAKRPKSERSRGQILILFVMAIFVFVGMVALVIDVSWYWVNSLRVQRAADAAALAGVVQLPTNPGGSGGAYALARAEAFKNGYADVDLTHYVTTVQDPPVTGRRLVVTVSAPVDMFFMRIFGLNTVQATRTSKAEFVLPVPMGSPENWYGVFGKVRGLTSTTTTTVPPYTTDDGPRTTSAVVPSTSPAPATPIWTRTPTAGWTLITAVGVQDTAYAQTSVNGSNQEWGGFDLLSGLGAAETATTVNKIQVDLTDVHVSATCASTTIRVALSYDAGLHWTSNVAGPLPAGNVTPALGTSTTTGDYSFGTASMAAWPLTGPVHTWSGNDLGNSNFRVRLTAAKGCATAGTQLRVDRLQVTATYRYDTLHPAVTTTSTTTLPDADLKGPGTACAGVAACYKPNGATLTPRGFWGTMNTEGAESVNGDAYQPYWNKNDPTTALNPNYDADNYYNYAVEMPAGSTGGAVYVYDPVFCATAHDKGTGDRWFSGAGSAVSSFYELYDTNGTLYDPGDDGAPVASSNGLFRSISASDSTMGGGTSGNECYYSTNGTYGDGRDFHSNWYLLAGGLAGGTTGKVYRLHTTSTDPANIADQRSVDGENSFALYVGATGGTPRIYGIGAMQAFTPLSASGSTVQSEFYLAQIDAVHAGKTVQIKLWDAGDTGSLAASLEILVPTSTGWAATNFDYTAAQGTTNGASSCNALTGSDVPSVVTNTGGTSRLNGCWLTIQIPIPGGYTAPQSGWWKIRYTMSGSGVSDDVTTWKVEIRGNPVHLIVP